MTTENSRNRKLLTIITETAIESSLIEDFDLLGVSGYTIVDARGKGSHGTRNAGWDTNSNIRIEILCEPELENKISEYLKEKYYENYAMVMYVSDSKIVPF